MKTHKLLLAAAAALSACGCASFTSGDVLVEKETAQAMFDDHTLAPFADIQLSWINYPYRSPTDSIAGETTVDDKGRFTAQQAAPVQVPPEDLVRLAKPARGFKNPEVRHAREIVEKRHAEILQKWRDFFAPEPK